MHLPAPNLAFFEAFIGTNPFDLTHWHDSEIYGEASTDWWADVVLWGGPQIYDPHAQWQDFTDADSYVERAYHVKLGPRELHRAMGYVIGVASTDPERQRKLYLSREAVYETGRWMAGQWRGHAVTRQVADQLWQLAARLEAGDFTPQVLFTS